MNACVPLSESVSQRQAMSPLGFFFLPGAPPGRVLATCQEWRSEEKVVSRESKTPSRVAVTCHRTQNGNFAAGRKLSFPGRVEEATRSSGRGCSVWRAKNTRMPIGARLSRAERSRPCARVPREWLSNLTPGKHRGNSAATQGRVNGRPGSHPVDGRRPLSNTHGAALIRKRISAVGAPSPPCDLADQAARSLGEAAEHTSLLLSHTMGSASCSVMMGAGPRLLPHCLNGVHAERRRSAQSAASAARV